MMRSIFIPRSIFILLSVRYIFTRNRACEALSVTINFYYFFKMQTHLTTSSLRNNYFRKLPSALLSPAHTKCLATSFINYKLQNTTKTNYQATTKARQRTKSQIPYALQFDELHQDE